MFGVSSSDFYRHRLAPTLLLLLLLGAGPLLSSVKAEDESQTTSQENQAAENAGVSDQVTDEFRVEVIEQVPECVRTSQNGNLLEIYYTGYLADGTVFDAR
jgi:FKBP-type peptidyl-prolyl cis-trans isomerase